MLPSHVKNPEPVSRARCNRRQPARARGGGGGEPGKDREQEDQRRQHELRLQLRSFASRCPVRRSHLRPWLLLLTRTSPRRQHPRRAKRRHPIQSYRSAVKRRDPLGQILPSVNHPPQNPRLPGQAPDDRNRAADQRLGGLPLSGQKPPSDPGCERARPDPGSAQPSGRTPRSHPRACRVSRNQIAVQIAGVPEAPAGRERVGWPALRLCRRMRRAERGRTAIAGRNTTAGPTRCLCAPALVRLAPTGIRTRCALPLTCGRLDGVTSTAPWEA